ncbi:MAG TPA: S16 family serine protease, partial [Thermoanaerobaculia bacterium]|nr:S16 family serine protease [Thermoanaerobaculia bacterium]
LAGIHVILVPKLNRRDLIEVPAAIQEGLTFHFVEHMGEVLDFALLPAVVEAGAAEPAAAPAETPEASPVAVLPPAVAASTAGEAVPAAP